MLLSRIGLLACAVTLAQRRGGPPVPVVLQVLHVHRCERARPAPTPAPPSRVAGPAVITDPYFKDVVGELEQSSAEFGYDLVLSDGEEKVCAWAGSAAWSVTSAGRPARRHAQCKCLLAPALNPLVERGLLQRGVLANVRSAASRCPRALVRFTRHRSGVRIDAARGRDANRRPNRRVHHQGCARSQLCAGRTCWLLRSRRTCWPQGLRWWRGRGPCCGAARAKSGGCGARAHSLTPRSDSRIVRRWFGDDEAARERQHVPLASHRMCAPRGRLLRSSAKLTHTARRYYLGLLGDDVVSFYPPSDFGVDVGRVAARSAVAPARRPTPRRPRREVVRRFVCGVGRRRAAQGGALRAGGAIEPRGRLGAGAAPRGKRGAGALAEQRAAERGPANAHLRRARRCTRAQQWPAHWNTGPSWSVAL